MTNKKELLLNLAYSKKSKHVNIDGYPIYDDDEMDN